MENDKTRGFKIPRKSTFKIYDFNGVYLFVESKIEMHMCLFMLVISIPSYTHLYFITYIITFAFNL